MLFRSCSRPLKTVGVFGRDPAGGGAGVGSWSDSCCPNPKKGLATRNCSEISEARTVTKGVSKISLSPKLSAASIFVPNIPVGSPCSGRYLTLTVVPMDGSAVDNISSFGDADPGPRGRGAAGGCHATFDASAAREDSGIRRMDIFPGAERNLTSIERPY